MTGLDVHDPAGLRAPDGRLIPWHRPRGSRIKRHIALFLMRLGGWRLDFHVPDLPKMVAILGHHTSNWDGVWCVVVKYVVEDRPVAWIMKDTAYKFPFRAALDWLGCIPVNRRAPEGFVEQAARRFMESDSVVLSITPEGTRKRTDQWKSGFYRIAQACDIPIVPVYLDYKRREFGTGTPFWPSGDYTADMHRLAEFYAGRTPRNPELAGDIR